MIETELGTLMFLGDLDEFTLLDYGEWIEPEGEPDGWPDHLEYVGDGCWDLSLHCFFSSLSLGVPKAIELAELLIQHCEGDTIHEIETRLALTKAAV